MRWRDQGWLVGCGTLSCMLLGVSSLLFGVVLCQWQRRLSVCSRFVYFGLSWGIFLW